MEILKIKGFYYGFNWDWNTNRVVLVKNKYKDTTIIGRDLNPNWRPIGIPMEYYTYVKHTRDAGEEIFVRRLVDFSPEDWELFHLEETLNDFMRP